MMRTEWTGSPRKRSRSARICSSRLTSPLLQMGDVGQAAHHAPVAQHAHDVHARVVGEEPEAPELEAKHVAEVAEDGDAVADHEDPAPRVGRDGVADGG